MARAKRIRQSEPTSVSMPDSIQIYSAGLYGRLSDLNNGKTEGDPLESQVHIMEQYVMERPYLKYVKLYLDNGYTGTNFDRPAWDEMMADICKGQINCIIVKDLSRLGRNYLEVGTFLEKDCPRLGIRFISINDGYDSASLNSNEELTAALKNIINDYYAKDISRKVCAALETKRKQGDYVGSYAPYGYWKDPHNKNHLVVDPVTAPVVQMIYQWRAGGDGYGTILRRLNEQNIPSPGRYRYEHGIITNNNKKGESLLWGRHAVTDILKNIVYLGHLAQGKTRASLHQGIPSHGTAEDEWDIVYNTHVPIVDEALFSAVQEINERNRVAYKQNYGKYESLPHEKNPYRKKLLCADCGTQMKLYHNLYRDGKKGCYTYICPTYEEHREMGCRSKKSIRSSKMDAVVLETIRKQMALFADAGVILTSLLARQPKACENSQRQNELLTLQQQLTRKNSYSLSLYSDWKDGLLTTEEYTFAKERYAADMETLKRQISEMEAVDKYERERVPRIQAFQKKVAKYCEVSCVTPELVDALIHEIRLSDQGNISITFRFEDEYRQIIKDIEDLKKEVA